jgi:amino acid adenylation domain-containing protein
MSVSFLHSIFKQLQQGDDSIACNIEDKYYTYKQLAEFTGSVQGKIQRTGSMNIGIVAQNNPQTYATILAAWLTGKAYVPFPSHYPVTRIEEILLSAEIGTVFYAEEDEEIDNLKKQFSEIEFINSSELPASDCFCSFPTEEKIAYLLFTSGTTGKPKGVPITFGNLQAFMDGFDALGYEVHSNDRFLQMFDLTFDLSVVCFTRPLMCGGSFYTLPAGMIKTLALYHVLDEYQITVSLMVPSSIGLLLPYLEDIHLPELRISQFCGEALKKDLLIKWMTCVPNARIDNVYGPTEATIYCTALTCTKQNIPHHSGIVGIGKPMKETELLLLDENGILVTEPKTEGELCLSGPQVTPGYLNNQEQNDDKFLFVNQTRYYKTGDIAFRNKSGHYFYSGRKDDQVKIQGYRIELGELESAAAKILPDNQSVAVGYQYNNNWYLALFIQKTAVDVAFLQESLKPILPQYMKPHHIFNLETIPLNPNGKTDRKRLKEIAEFQHSQL